MSENQQILISAEPLSIDKAYDFVLDAGCGANCLFVGTTRNKNKGEEVTHLDFESYASMAVKELEKIASHCLDVIGVRKVYIAHRTGHVAQKDIAVIIAVSSVHRPASFEACQYAIDRLKQTVPIWKKEFLLSGSHWVNDRP